MTVLKSAPIEVLFTELPFNQRFKAAKDAGFDFVELWTWDHLNMDEIKELTEHVGIKVSAMSGDKDHSLVDPTHKKQYINRIYQSIEKAKQIGCKTLVIHSNALAENGAVINHYNNLSDCQKYCSMYDMLKELAPIAEHADITLVLEALNTEVEHAGNFLRHTSQAAEMIRILNSPYVKVLYDIYHMQINEGNICQTLSRYIDTIGYVHAADVPGRHEPGTGEINYSHVLKHLENIGYLGIVGFEMWPKFNTQIAVKAVGQGG